jgi:hypothetical protein
MIRHAKPRVRSSRPLTLEMRETADKGSCLAVFLSCVKRLRERWPGLNLSALSMYLSGFRRRPGATNPRPASPEAWAKPPEVLFLRRLLATLS